MSFPSFEFSSSVMPPRPGAPVPPDSPVKPTRPNRGLEITIPATNSQVQRKRLRSDAPLAEPEIAQHLRKRQKGVKGAVQRAASIITRALSRESLLSRTSSQDSIFSDLSIEEGESKRAAGPSSRRGGRNGGRISLTRTDSALSLTSPVSPTFSIGGLPTEGAADLRATPISRSVVWNDRDSLNKSTSSTNGSPARLDVVKINRFVVKSLSDLILRSNDAKPITFYADKATLFDASPVLRFRASEVGTTTMREGRPTTILTVDEPADLLRDLLSLVYVHVEQPVVTSSDDLDHLLGISRRYQVSSALHTLCSTHLHDLAVHEPLRAYGLACKHDLHAEKAWAARETLRVHLAKADITHDLASCSPSQIRHLVQMHARRGGAAHALVTAARSCDEFACSGEHCEGGVAEWWLEVIRQSKPELTARPNSNVVFSPIFLAGCVRVASAQCPDCPMHFFGAKTQHRLARVKDDIDALPAGL